MIDFNAIFLFIRDWLNVFATFLRARLMTELQKDMEIISLRSQLSITQQYIVTSKTPKPRPKPAFRQLWVLLSKVFPAWESSLFLVKPGTVIGWHKTAFKFYWKKKSKSGRPKVSRQTIALIKQIHKENPLLSPEKIYERLIALAITDAPCPNTIAKYIPKIRKPPTEKQKQSWKTFLKNHSKGIWAMDFFVVPTLHFKVLYVLLILSHDRRKIEHFAVTANHSSAWVVQQLREATTFDKTPEYLIHDNGKIFNSRAVQDFLTSSQIKPKRTGYHCPWQNCYCERAIGIFRRELLDHIIPFNEKHLKYLLKEFVSYYNTVRTHQGINCETPIKADKSAPTAVVDTILESESMLGGLYHSYRKAA